MPGGPGHLSLAQLYVATAVEGTLFVFYDLASFSSLRRLVSTAFMGAATSQNEASYYAAGLIGPSIGGILYQVGRGLPFLIDALSYLASVLSLLFLKADLRRERLAGSRHLGAEVLEGLRWMRHQPIILSLSLLGGGDAFVSSGLTLLVIILAKQQHASPGTIGLIFSLAGIGGVLGAITGGQVPKLLSFAQTTIGVRWALVLLWPLYTIAPNPVALGIITATIYFLNPISNMAGISYGLPLIPPELMGRVSGVFQLIPAAMAPLGVTLTGLALQAVGPRATVVIATAIVLALALMITLNRHVRRAPRLPVQSV